MDYDVFESVSQGSDAAQNEENSRIAEIADELHRLCQLHETEHGVGKEDVTFHEYEQRVAENLAKGKGFWIPMLEVLELGVPGPSGHENDTYVSDNAVFKVNNLLNSGSIYALFQKVLLHNIIFPDTSYQFYGFAGFDGRTVQPVFKQVRVSNAKPATQIMIDTYMAALGFDKGKDAGNFYNDK